MIKPANLIEKEFAYPKIIYPETIFNKENHIASLPEDQKQTIEVEKEQE